MDGCEFRLFTKRSHAPPHETKTKQKPTCSYEYARSSTKRSKNVCFEKLVWNRALSLYMDHEKRNQKKDGQQERGRCVTCASVAFLYSTRVACASATGTVFGRGLSTGYIGRKYAKCIGGKIKEIKVSITLPNRLQLTCQEIRHQLREVPPSGHVHEKKTEDKVSIVV